MTTKTEAKQIVDRLVAAFAATWIFPPAATRLAATQIRAIGLDPDEREIADAFAALLDKRADNNERRMIEAFAPKGETGK